MPSLSAADAPSKAPAPSGTQTSSRHAPSGRTSQPVARPNSSAPISRRSRITTRTLADRPPEGACPGSDPGHGREGLGQREAAAPDGAPDDGALAAGVAEAGEVVERRDAAGGEHGELCRLTHGRQQRKVGALERAVATGARDEQAPHARRRTAPRELD